MLVCNVSLLRRRAAITASVAETALADDAATTGNVVFATLVDDPASVADLVDAWLGEIMLEAAAASDTIDIGLAYAAAIDEAVTAAHVTDATVGVVAIARQAMLPTAFVNSSGAPRQANVNGVMVNL